MIKYFPLNIVIIACLTIPSQAVAKSTRILHIELSYSGIAASYNLYKNGELVCSSASNGQSQIDCSVEIDPSPMTFVLTAVDENGVESPQSTPYILTPPETPTAKFVSTATAKTAPAMVSYDASKSDDLDGMIVHYIWDFGDGSKGSGKFIDHTYSAPGTYITQLTVIDDDNYSAKKTAKITIDRAQSPSIYTGTTTPPTPASSPPPTNSSSPNQNTAKADPDDQIAPGIFTNSLWSSLLSRIISLLSHYIFALNQ